MSGLRAVGADETREVPPCPEGLTPTAQARWAAYWADPISQYARPIDFHAIQSWIKLVSECEELEARLAATPTVLGARGKPKANPLGQVLREYRRRVTYYERQFGMTPKARKKLNELTAQLLAAQRALGR